MTGVEGQAAHPESHETSTDGEIRVSSIGSSHTYFGHATTLLKEPAQKRQLTIMATGNAIPRAVMVAELVKRSIRGIHQINKCGSTTMSQHSSYGGSDVPAAPREVPFIEIVLSLDPLDESNIGYQAPVSEEELLDEATIQRLSHPRNAGYDGARSFRGRGHHRGSWRGNFRSGNDHHYNRGGYYHNRGVPGGGGHNRPHYMTDGRGYNRMDVHNGGFPNHLIGHAMQGGGYPMGGNGGNYSIAQMYHPGGPGYMVPPGYAFSGQMMPMGQQMNVHMPTYPNQSGLLRNDGEQ